LTADASALSVCDTGSAVSDEVLGDLLRAPVPSASGLGIGLYHAARQAEICGYELRLASNAPGRVCFELRRCQPGSTAAT
jgi:sensor histidine kinase regulating citrate/malate metabolism